ncbi:MAG: MmgE/PrpD family protein [Nitrospinota bacterium]
MLTLSERMAAFAEGFRYEDIPPGALRMAKTVVLDSLGCALGGFGQEDCRILRSFATAQGSVPEGTLIGSGERVSAVDASLVNSVLIRVLDFNDVYWKQDPSHPSDLLGGALALAEREGKGGRELLTALVLGYEFELRLCEAARPGIRELGWHHATLTSVASPILAGKLLGLTATQMAHAIGISAVHGPTLGAATAGALSMMKNTVDPLAVQRGVWAALLAGRGCTGPLAVLEGPEGLFAEVGEGWDAGALTEGLGEGGEMRIEKVSLKAFAAEYLTHSPITALLALREAHGLRAENVRRITVKTSARAAQILGDPAKYEPATKETADHSLPYCMAAALVDGEVTPAQFAETRLWDPRIRALLPKVKVEVAPEMEALTPENQPALVEVETTSGEVFSREVRYARGDPRDPMSEEEVEAKFRALASEVLSAERQDELLASARRLEEVERIGDLVALTVAEQG